MPVPANPHPLPPTLDPILRLWLPPPHSYDLATGTGTYICPSYCQDPAFTPDARAKSRPRCAHPPTHLPSLRIDPAHRSGTCVDRPVSRPPAEPSEAHVDRPYCLEVVDENMSLDGARRIVPLSSPPTVCVVFKELTADGPNQGGGLGIEYCRYGVDAEDGGAPAPPFPPVRDDPGLKELRTLSNSPFDPAPFVVVSGQPLTWAVDSEINSTASPSGTVFDEQPPSPSGNTRPSPCLKSL